MRPCLANRWRRRVGMGTDSRRSCSGQSLIESCLVLAVICLAFFGILEIALMYAAQDVLDYAAARGARAKTVGFNRFMVYKTIRVGAIPNAGRLLTPALAPGPLGELNVELGGGADGGAIPRYLGAQQWGELDGILRYEAWDTVGIGLPSVQDDGRVIGMEVTQDKPFLSNNVHRAFYSGDYVPLHGEAYIDNHYSLYMEEDNW